MSDYKTPLPGLLAQMLETGINQVLALDENSADRLRNLRDRTLAVELTGLAIKLYFSAMDDRFKVSAQFDGEPDTTITGTPTALFAMGLPEWGSSSSGVEIRGNANLARDLEQLFGKLEPDWEEPLSQVFGDVIGHQIGVALREGNRWAKQAMQSTSTAVSEYIREESGLTVQRDELDEFNTNVDQFRAAGERLEARISKLEKEREG